MKTPRVGDVIRCKRCKLCVEVTYLIACTCPHNCATVAMSRLAHPSGVADIAIEYCVQCRTDDEALGETLRRQEVDAGRACN